MVDINSTNIVKLRGRAGVSTWIYARQQDESPRAKTMINQFYIPDKKKTSASRYI